MPDRIAVRAISPTKLFWKRPEIPRKVLVKVATVHKNQSVYETLRTALEALGFNLLPAEGLNWRQRQRARYSLFIGGYAYYVFKHGEENGEEKPEPEPPCPVCGFPRRALSRKPWQAGYNARGEHTRKAEPGEGVRV